MNCEGFSIEISTFLPQTNFVSLLPRRCGSPFRSGSAGTLRFALPVCPAAGPLPSGKGKRLLARRAPHHPDQNQQPLLPDFGLLLRRQYLPDGFAPSRSHQNQGCQRAGRGPQGGFPVRNPLRHQDGDRRRDGRRNRSSHQSRPTDGQSSPRCRYSGRGCHPLPERRKNLLQKNS